MTVTKFVSAMKKAGGIPRSEKWLDVNLKTPEENIDRIPEEVKKELDLILKTVQGKSFMIIGGTAVVAYVPYRASFDVDILTYPESGIVTELEGIYKRYRDTTPGQVQTHFFTGQHTDKVHVMTVSEQTYDITWSRNAREVAWHGYKFLIPHIDTLTEMKKLSGRAVDGEDAEALKHWRRHWAGKR